MASIGDLVVRLSANAKPLQSGLAAAQSSVSSFAAAAGRAAMVAGTAILGAAAAGGLYAIKVASGAETLRSQFEVLLKDATAARKIMEDINKFAASTPLQTEEIAQAAKMLLAFGSSSTAVIGELRMLGDIATGIGAPLTDIAEIYGKARTQGRLFGEDINQLTGRGIPIIQGLAQVLGVTDSEVKKLVSDGRVGFAEMAKAMQLMTTKGGQFEGMMTKMSETTSGKWSTFKDNITAVVRELGEGLLPIANKVLDWANSVSGKFILIAKIAAVAFGNVGLTIEAMWETARDYTIAAFDYIVAVAPVMAQNIATAVKNVFLQLQVEMRRIGEEIAFFMGLSDSVQQIPDAIGQGMIAIPDFAAPDLGPAGEELAKKIEEILNAQQSDFADQIEAPVDHMAGLDRMGKNKKAAGSQSETKFAEAMQKGSANAFSTILANMRSGRDPQVQALKNLTGVVKAGVSKPLAVIAQNTKPNFAPEFT